MDNLRKKAIEFRVRAIGGKIFLIGNKSCYEINESTKSIWKALNAKRTIDDVIVVLKEEFIFDESDDIYRMVNECIDYLVEIGAAK